METNHKQPDIVLHATAEHLTFTAHSSRGDEWMQASYGRNIVIFDISEIEEAQELRRRADSDGLIVGMIPEDRATSD
jgi:hypothetical protein